MPYSRQCFLALPEYFFRHRLAIDIRRLSRHGPHKLLQIRVADCDYQRKVTRDQLRGVGQQLGRSIPIHKIGENNNKRTPMTVTRKEIECSSITRLDHLRLEAVQRVHQPVHLVPALSRRQITEHSTAKRHESHIVSSCRGNVSDRQRCVDRMIELRQLSNSRSHEPAHIQKNDDVLAALDRILASDELAPARSRRPRDMPYLISDDKFAKGFEFPALPPDSHSPDARLRPPIPMRIELVLLRFLNVWIDLHVPRSFVSKLSPQQSEWRSKPQNRVSKLVASPGRREQFVAPRSRATRRDGQLSLARALQIHWRWVLVLYNERNLPPRAIRNLYGDVVRSTHRETVLHVPLD